MSGLPLHLEAITHTAHTRRRALHQPITHQCVEHMPPDTIELCIPLQGGARPRPPRQPRLRHSTGGSVSCRSFTPPTHHSATSRHDTHMHVDLCHNHQHKPADWPSGCCTLLLCSSQTRHIKPSAHCALCHNRGVSDLTPRETLAAGSCACAEKERNTSRPVWATRLNTLGWIAMYGRRLRRSFHLEWNNKGGQTYWALRRCH